MIIIPTPSHPTINSEYKPPTTFRFLGEAETFTGDLKCSPVKEQSSKTVDDSLTQRLLGKLKRSELLAC